MEQTGTLRKRRKRILSKVKGLSIIPYEASNDNFTGRDLFAAPGEYSTPNNFKKQFSMKTDSDTRLQFSSSALLKLRREAESTASQKGRSIYGRVTRDPSFHVESIVNIESSGNATNSDIATNKEENENAEKLGKIPGDMVVQREYFLDKQMMQRLQQIILLGIATGSVPWKWDKNTCRVERWGPFLEKIWWLAWIIVTVQNISIAVFQVKTFVHAVSVAETYRSAFQSSFSLLWYVYNLLLKLFLFYYKEPTREYINTLLKFNKSYVKKYVIHLDDIEDGGRWVINGAILTNFAQVGISTSFYFLMAEQPWYLFSFIAPKPWYWRLPGAFHEFMLTGQVVVTYTLIAWMIVAHSNTLKFWLSETHNQNDSDYTTDELRSPKTAMETYRTIQVLQTLFNNCISAMGIPFLKITMSTGMIPTGYVLVRSMNHLFIDEFPGILTYPFTIFDCAAVAFVTINLTAEVFDMGCSFVDSWSLTKQKDFRRMLMSCSGLKLWVGRYYFMTISTTVTFVQEVFDNITNCILTFP